MSSSWQLHQQQDVDIHAGLMVAFICKSLLSWSLRRPEVWLLRVAILSVCPLGLSMHPFEERGMSGALDLARSWSLAPALIATAFGIVVLSRQDVLLRRIRARSRWLGELMALLMFSLDLSTPLWIGAGVANPPSSIDQVAEWVSFWPGLFLLCLHVACLGTVLLSIPVPASMRTTGLLMFAWIVPSLLNERWLGRPLDPTGYFDLFHVGSGASFRETSARLLGLSAWVLAGAVARCGVPPGSMTDQPR